MSGEERVLALLDEWEQLTKRGDPVDPRALCRDCPELLPELTRQIDQETQLRQWSERLEGLPNEPPEG